MEPLFLAVICGCNAGLFRDALHEVYLPRIQRGNASFAANILGVRGALLSVSIHFFEHLQWDSPVEVGLEEHEPTQNIAAKKRAHQEHVDSDYLFGNAKKGNAQNQNKISLTFRIARHNRIPISYRCSLFRISGCLSMA